ncbi:unnamed protein product [Brassicogethes aeneus]|uniref:Centrosomal protein of 78 kDa n=1 Tax=Brassicogethes aeneus TaxID=1431903 RepID=A0A9P0B6N4_BRAAE|nr:unnamed protein product [Brassicogethes aeneus]
MTESSKSSVRVNTKPVNVFYVWYSELCRRLNSNPAPTVKPAKYKSKTVLDFVADRLKFEEWSPVINALRHDTSLHVINIRSRIGNCQFLHDIDTEEKARKLKRRYGVLWTAFILKNLLRSISCSIKNTQVLTCLELDGLPMFSQYLEPLLQALKKNNTVKSLSLANCVINDSGCELMCAYLRFTPNVEVINLSGCGLTAESGAHIAKLVKHQQINRYCESWHRSLRYEDPDSSIMRGLKRLTLNRNPLMGNEGICYILKELEDDLWIKALDMQKCGITDDVAQKIVELLDYSKSLEIIDIRQNEGVNIQTIEKILQLLKQKQLSGYEPEYQWCDTALSLSLNTARSSNISCVENSMVKPSKTSVLFRPLRKSKTVESVSEKNDEAKKQILKLNSQLEREITKRKATEKKNLELKKSLNEFKCASTTKCTAPKTKGNFKTVISVIEKLKPVRNSVPMLKNVDNLEIKPPRNTIFTSTSNVNRNQDQLKNGLRSKLDHGDVGQNNKILKNGEIRPQKNGFIKNGYNGFSQPNGYNNASNIFEQLIKSSTVIDDVVDEDEEFLELLKAPDKYKTNNCNELSSSQTSLYNFIEELKSTNSINPTHKPSTNHPK